MNQRESEAGDQPDARRAMVHDLRQCLYTIHLGLRLLKQHRLDEEKFTQLCESIEKERLQANELLQKILSESSNP